MASNGAIYYSETRFNVLSEAAKPEGISLHDLRQAALEYLYDRGLLRTERQSRYRVTEKGRAILAAWATTSRSYRKEPE